MQDIRSRTHSSVPPTYLLLGKIFGNMGFTLLQKNTELMLKSWGDCVKQGGVVPQNYLSFYSTV